jgi:hypothetical protein
MSNATPRRVVARVFRLDVDDPPYKVTASMAPRLLATALGAPVLYEHDGKLEPVGRVIHTFTERDGSGCAVAEFDDTLVGSMAAGQAARGIISGVSLSHIPTPGNERTLELSMCFRGRRQDTGVFGTLSPSSFNPVPRPLDTDLPLQQLLPGYDVQNNPCGYLHPHQNGINGTESHQGTAANTVSASVMSAPAAAAPPPAAAAAAAAPAPSPQAQSLPLPPAAPAAPAAPVAPVPHNDTADAIARSTELSPADKAELMAKLERLQQFEKTEKQRALALNKQLKDALTAGAKQVKDLFAILTPPDMPDPTEREKIVDEALVANQNLETAAVAASKFANGVQYCVSKIQAFRDSRTKADYDQRQDEAARFRALLSSKHAEAHSGAAASGTLGPVNASNLKQTEEEEPLEPAPVNRWNARFSIHWTPEQMMRQNAAVRQPHHIPTEEEFRSGRGGHGKRALDEPAKPIQASDAQPPVQRQRTAPATSDEPPRRSMFDPDEMLRAAEREGASVNLLNS